MKRFDYCRYSNSSIATNIEGQSENIENGQFHSELSKDQIVIKDKSIKKNGMPPISTLPVEEILKSYLTTLDLDNCETESDNAFFVADLGEIYRQHLRWKTNLPRVEPFYAVKCNTDLTLLRLLAALGTGFDCASKSEIKTILDMGIDPSKIIYANPCKQSSFIRFAAEHDVKMMTFDNAEELRKIKRFFPNAQLVIRILTDDSKALIKLGTKFGASLNNTGFLLQTARDLGLSVIGVSFHVGSGCYDENAYIDAIHRARFVFDQATELGFNFHLLDVGGGFSFSHKSDDGISFEKIAALLGPAIDKYFPPNIRVIAEPGRYYAAPAFTIATHIIAKRTVRRDIEEEYIPNMNADQNDVSPTGDDHPAFMYYINDGLYGAFNCILYDHQLVTPKVLMKGGNFLFGETLDEPEYSCFIWGPTCDSIDCITKNGSLPELLPGDWLYFEEMGAYTIAAATKFNGFKQSKIIYTTTEPHVLDVLSL
ncbi:14821_t:CDS:2 [Funneliformis mosseae]|uniref:ornithine decarboxylase n=1 Tax=Funneliformis mosseae TaxID=27381 RepID=A0A9N9BYD7_FUNMO|nr:14821_t:CDS:2 [Funneliformis mosseae]